MWATFHCSIEYIHHFTTSIQALKLGKLDRGIFLQLLTCGPQNLRVYIEEVVQQGYSHFCTSPAKENQKYVVYLKKGS